MFFLIQESIEARVREQRGVRRKYIVTWQADNAGADPDIVSVGTDTALEDATPDLARSAVIAWMGLSGQTIDSVPMNYSLSGFPTSEMSVEEVSGTEGRIYKADASWRAADSDASKPDRQAPQSSLLGVMVEVANQGPVVISQGVSIRAGSAGKSADFLELRNLFIREDHLEDWLDERGFAVPPMPADFRRVVPFTPGHLDVLQTGVDEAALKPGTVDINPIPANFNISIEMSGAALKSSFLENILRAADNTATNSASFTIQGMTFQAQELALVEASFSYNENNTQVNLGFATGEQVAWDTTDNFGMFVHNGNHKYQEMTDDGGDESDSVEFQDASGILYPFDYVWTFSPSRTIEVEGVNTVVTDVDFVSVHKVFPSTDYSVLFGTNSL